METEVVNGIVQLGQYGTVGVILALILLVALIGWLFFKFASNHVEHNNQAFKEVADSNIQVAESLTSLKDVIEYKLK